jgi:arginine repressor
MEEFFEHFTGLLYTKGVQSLAESAGAYWLIDAVASYQLDKRVRNNQRLLEFQLWELDVKDHNAYLTVKADSGEASVVAQFIEYTNFPLGSIKLYVCNNTLMLPSEY